MSNPVILNDLSLSNLVVTDIAVFNRRLVANSLESNKLRTGLLDAQDLMVDDAMISTLDVDDLTAGTLTVTGASTLSSATVGDVVVTGTITLPVITTTAITSSSTTVFAGVSAIKAGGEVVLEINGAITVMGLGMGGPTPLFTLDDPAFIPAAPASGVWMNATVGGVLSVTIDTAGLVTANLINTAVTAGDVLAGQLVYVVG
jgi:hypothetical protein